MAGPGLDVNPVNIRATADTAVLAPTPTPALCSPRPNVSVSAVPAGSGVLQVTVRTGTTPASPANRLTSLHIGAATNALIDIPNGPTGVAGNVNVTLPAGATHASFTVRRVEAGSGATVQLVAVDSCGAWPTFVGGGPGAF